VAAFSYKGTQESAPNSTTLSQVLNLPTGSTSPAVGDPMFLVCRGNTSGTAFTWTPPSGWTEIGSVVRATATSGSKNALQVFWKTYDTGTSLTVTTTTFGTFSWQIGVFVFTGTGTAKLVGTPVDETATASTTFQPAAYTAESAATILSVIAQAGVGGTGSYTTANGFTSRGMSAFTTPRTTIGDQDVGAGSVTMPSQTSGFSQPWLSKTFALNAQSNTGWSVGQIKY
jgi:hypothetical protein